MIFLNLIKSKIDILFPEFDYSKLSFVKDGDQALINSIYKIFPESLMFRCHLHISKNIIYNLKKSNFNYSQKTQIKRQFDYSKLQFEYSNGYKNKRYFTKTN